MNLYDYLLRDKPRASFKLDSAGTTYQDISGNGFAISGTPTFGISVIAGATKSMLVNSATTMQFTSPVFKAGYEQVPFTLEAVALLSSSGGSQSILSHASTGALFDGLSFLPNGVKFSVKFALGQVDATWYFDTPPEAYHLVGIYTPQKISLYVNGSLAAETDIPYGYPESGFNHGADTYLTAGSSSTTTAYTSLDAPTFYGYALTPDQITSHYNSARDTIVTALNVAAFGGTSRDGTARRAALQRTWSIADDWTLGVATNINWNDVGLIPSLDPSTNISMAGSWVIPFEIAAPELTTLPGIQLDWNADGSYTIDASLDSGTTWQTNLTNGDLVPTSFNVNTTDDVMLVRVNFAGGLTADTSVVRWITATAYEDANVYGSDVSRVVTLSGYVSSSLNSNEPIERNNRQGLRFTNGTANVLADANSPASTVRTVEFWVKARGASSGQGGYIYEDRTTGGTSYIWIPESNGLMSWGGFTTVYLNGVATSNNTYSPKNKWTHIVGILPSNLNIPFYLGTGSLLGEIGEFSMFPTALSASDALALYSNYTKVPVMSYMDPSVPVIFEPATPYVITVGDWEVIPQA